MNGIHDMGGMHGFGPVVREENEPVFHAQWEAEVAAISRAVRRPELINIDEFRHAIERMNPADYLASSYYARWLDGIARLLIEKGVVSAEALDQRTAFFAEHAELPATAAVATPLPPLVPREEGLNYGYARPAATPPRFQVGDPVTARVEHPHGHTRLPRYVRGKRGVIHTLHGIHVFPDANASRLGEQPAPLYSVRFAARELWGDAAEPHGSVCIDLWEPYLLPVEHEGVV